MDKNNIFKVFYKIKKPAKLIKYILVSAFIYLVIIFINYQYICKRLTDYFEINNLNSTVLTQYSMSDLYQNIIETLSKIYSYEMNTNHKFIATELWSKDLNGVNDYPKFVSNSFNIYNHKNKTKVLNSISKNENIFLYKNNNYYIGVVIPIYLNSKLGEKRLQYRAVLYNKMFDFWFLGKFDFLTVSIAIYLFIFMVFILLFAFPLNYMEIIKELNIEKRAILSIRNLIEHTLVNQEAILKYALNIEEKISKSLAFNNEAQTLLKDVHHEEIDIIKFLKYYINRIYIPKNINVICKINIFNKVMFSKNILELSLDTIINNATHSSVEANLICINVMQKKVNNNILIQISNDGMPISEENRKKIFKGKTTKNDGHGVGLKNLKDLLSEAGSDLCLLKSKKTTFSFNTKYSPSKKRILEEFNLERISKIVDEVKPLSFEAKKYLPLVVIIEDEESIWNGWKVRMTDANLVFFKNPDDFFLYSDKEKYSGNKFISSISMILCDFDFGNDYNLSNADFFETLDKEEEKFNGYFVLCTGFNDSIIKTLPKKLLKKINSFYQKRPASYSDIINIIKN